MLKVRRHSARAKFRLARKRSRGVAKLGWNVGAVQAGRTPLKSLPVRAVRSRPGYWWASARGREDEETDAPSNHGPGGLRASSNGDASFTCFTSTPCGPDTVWLGPTERWLRRYTGRPPLPALDAPPGLETCWQRSQHAERRYAGLRYAGCNLDHVSLRRSLQVAQPASLGAENACPCSSVSWPAARVSLPR